MKNTAERVSPVESTPTDVDVHADSAMAALMAEVASDAASEPARYLRDSIVPEGGE